ncbi:hypothetical protein EUZ85_09270 [Hahella sp. KA22]|uniref:HAD-IA family hydrolase n=1 Tax=Hahella sp. KA22 TaxID=1628392 RepID=UPI000FDE61FD|nr:HAD-IA family hydrolase [Hahella sp. KA22]AZZ90900.1 hypothetical protein ENC22_06715 [Hahella sp. KA22]QAY54270.1 hypothetical protein EUZ85_09270 [Hahella sp. KA22]
MTTTFLNKYRNILDSYEIISLDVFDTAITRSLTEPTDIFSILESLYNNPDFKKFRVDAEKHARETRASHEDITLGDIYSTPLLDDEYIEKEIEIELKYCKANNEIKEAYDYLINKNKKVIFTSDMYLPQKIVEKILNNNDYTNIYRLYVSSETGVTKSTGNAYKEILSDFPNKKILHIGDNFNSDYKSAKKNRIDSIHYNFSNYSERACQHPYVRSLFNYGTTAEKSLASLYRDIYISQKSGWFIIGYIYLGIILKGFTSWIEKKLHKMAPDTVLFLSRDGFLPYAWIEKESLSFNSKYVYCSRRMMSIALLGKEKDQTVVARSLGLRKKIHPFIESLNIPTLKDGKSIDIKSIEIEGTNIENYYKKFISRNSKVAIIDIGWKGTCQAMLEAIFKSQNITFQGYYLGVSPNPRTENVEGYYCDKGFPRMESLLVEKGCEVAELLFTAPHPSVKSIDSKGAPVFYNDNNIDYKNIEEMHAGAMAFLDDLEALQAKTGLVINHQYQGRKALSFLLSSPGHSDAMILGTAFHTRLAGEAKQKMLIHNVHRANGGAYDKVIFTLTAYKSFWIEGAIALLPRKIKPLASIYFALFRKYEYLLFFIQRKGVFEAVRAITRKIKSLIPYKRKN